MSRTSQARSRDGHVSKRADWTSWVIVKVYLLSSVRAIIARLTSMDFYGQMPVECISVPRRHERDASVVVVDGVSMSWHATVATWSAFRQHS